MIRFSSRNLSAIIPFVFLLVFVSFSLNLYGQTKKTLAPKNKTQTSSKINPQTKTADKKTSANKTKDSQTKTPVKKNSLAKTAADKNSVKSDKNSAGKDSLTKANPAKNSAKNERNKQINSKRQQELKRQQEEEEKFARIRQAEEEQRRKIEEARRHAEEEARRQVILEEKHRREQARREAEARRRAFEKSLHTETTANIINDDTEGEDLEVRRAAVKALGKHAGMVVVMEPQTGKVLSIVNQDWAIRRSFKPCSTIKLVTGVAGLNENLIKEDGNIRSRRFPMNLDDALAFSNNRYFQRVGANLGSSKMISYAQALGLGQATGINSENETSGKLPYKNKNVRIYSHGDDFEVSPLQLAVMVSAISNGGKIVVPKIPRTTFDKTNFRGAMRRQVKLPDQNLKGVVPGMIGAASYGTARRGVDHSLGIAGKTGSCIADGSWVGLFASVAPIENPQVAVVVITRGEDERGKYAAAVAGKIYQSMRFRLLENGSKNLAKVPEDLKPEPKINAKTSALLDKAEGEESEDNEAASIVKNETRKETIVGQTAPTAPKTIARSSGKSSNLFPSIVINVKRPRDEIVKKSRDEMSRQRIVTNK